MNYKPVRILEGTSLALLAVAGVIAAILVGMRLPGITQLGLWSVAGVFIASLSVISGVTLFSLGATFNYLVSLFHRRPIHQGLFGKPAFKHPLDHHFGWLGLVAQSLGLAAGVGSLALSLGGWPIERLWPYLVGATMLLMVGLQLPVSWLMMQFLAERSQREVGVLEDLGMEPCAE